MRTQKLFSIAVSAVLVSLSAHAQDSEEYILAEPGFDPSPTQYTSTETPTDGLSAVISAVEAVEDIEPDPALQREYRARTYINTSRGSRSDGFRTLSEARRLQFNRLTDDRTGISDRRFQIFERDQEIGRRLSYAGASYRSGYSSNNIAQIDRRNYVRPNLSEYRDRINAGADDAEQSTNPIIQYASTVPLGQQRKYPLTRYTATNQTKQPGTVNYDAIIQARQQRTYTIDQYTPGDGFVPANIADIPQDEVLVIEQYFDFGCGHCQRASIVDNQIEQAYGGAVEIKRKSMNFFPQSRPVHVAYECLRPQERSDLYAQTYFDHFDLGIDAAMAKALEAVEAVGYDADSFQKCTTSGGMESYLEQQKIMGAQKGIRGTPYYVFPDGTQLAGYQAYEPLMREIELQMQ